MTKGIFVLIPIGGAIAGGLLLAGQWRQAFHIRWLVAAALILVFITPELYCLWRQFDSHPEKVVFGEAGVSGVRFFFWDSQFGRFFNSGPITRSRGNPLDYFHIVLWAFLPWSIPLFAAVYDAGRSLMSTRPRAVEYFNLSGGVLTFVLLSASQFQLPHYLNIAFPFFAIITSAFLLSPLSEAGARWIAIWQWLAVGMLSGICLVLWLAFEPSERIASALLHLTLVVLVFGLLGHIREWKHWQTRPIVSLAMASAIANSFLNLVILPKLMKYEAGSQMALYVNQHFPGQRTMQFRNSESFAFDFYLQGSHFVTDQELLQDERLPDGVLIYGPPRLLRPYLSQLTVLHVRPNYPIGRVTLRFFNPATRAQAVDEAWLAQTRKSND